MSWSISLKVAVAGLVAAFLILSGFGPGAVPFIPEQSYTDALTAHWSAATVMRSAVLGGDYPLWQDVIFFASPFAANPLNKTSYPLQWLVILLPASLHLSVMVLLHLGIAGAGMWAWARSLDLRPEAAALATLAYVLAPRVVATLGAGHLDVLYALAWLPWLLWLLTQPVGNRGLYTLRVALVAALLTLADVRIALFGFLFAGGYAVWRSLVERAGRRLLWAAVGIVPFALLVAAMIVPLVQWQPYLSRAALTVAEAGEFSLEPFGLAGLLLPPHTGGGGFETMVYLSLPVLFLAVIGWASRPVGGRIFWGSAVVVAALWALGVNSPFWRTLAQFEPLRWFRVPGRAWLIVVLCAAVLAGYGLQALLAAADRWRDADPPKVIFWWRLVAAGAAGLLMACGITLLATGLIDLPQSAAALMTAQGLALGGVLLTVLLRRARARVVAVSLIALTFADVAVTGVQWLEWRDEDVWQQPYAPLAAALADADRVYSPSYALPQEVAHAYGLRLFYGADPFQLSAFVDAMEAASNVPIEGYSIVLPPLGEIESEDDLPFVNEGIDPDPAELARWRVSHVIAAYAFDVDGLTYVETVADVNIYRNERYDAAQPAPQLLPSATTARLNRITAASVWASAVAFVLVGLAITVLSIREVRRGE